MKTSIDFAMQISKKEILLELRGVLRTEHLENVREKLFSSVDGLNKIYFINVERAKFRDKTYLNIFLEFLNFVKGKDSETVFIFHNEECKDFFSMYFNIFKIYDSIDSFRRDSGFWEKLKATGITYQRSTGLRLAPGVTIVFMVLLAGWLLTLFSIISNQDKDIRNREIILNDLQNKYNHSVKVLEDLKSSVAPLKSMGFDIDTSANVPLGRINDWQEFLREKQNY